MIRCRRHHGINSIISSSSILTKTTTTTCTGSTRRYTNGIIFNTSNNVFCRRIISQANTRTKVVRKYPNSKEMHLSPSATAFRNSSNSSRVIANNNNDKQEEEEPFDLSLYYPSENLDDNDNDGLDADERAAAEEEKRQAIRDEIDSRTGRLWSDPWAITDEDWASGKTLKDLPVWTRDAVSRISLERVRLHPDGIPTLKTLSTTPLPPPQPPVPSQNAQPYIRHRRLLHRQKIRTAVSAFASPDKIETILSLPTAEEKQDAVDDLFEECQEAMRKVTVDGGKDGGVEEFVGGVLAYQPDFPVWVERELEGVLREAVRAEGERVDGGGGGGSVMTSGDEDEDEDEEKKDQEALPIFMDFHHIQGSHSADDSFNQVVPKLLRPMKEHHKDGPGRMLEEWEINADDHAKRIMARQCMRQISRLLLSSSSSSSSSQEGNDNEACRIYVRGEKGVGKTATIAAIVASARLSGHIVLYLPDGDRLRKNGYYVVPDDRRDGVYNLPRLAQEVCGQLLECHGKEMEGITLDLLGGRLEELMTPNDLRKVLSSLVGGDGDGGKGKGKKGKKKKADEEDDVPPPPLALNDLLKLGSEDEELSSGIYGAVLHTLMNQSEVPFTIVCDQFNCYFDRGEYFHGHYDPKVRKSIPPNRISLFEPFLSAIGLEKDDDGNIRAIERPTLMKRGGIVVANTGSHAVVDRATKGLDDAVDGCGGIIAVDVPRFSPIEVEHVLANFEATGIGRLRLDQGATVMDDQEVAYLRMVSGGVGQKLLDACIH